MSDESQVVSKNPGLSIYQRITAFLHKVAVEPALDVAENVRTYIAIATDKWYDGVDEINEMIAQFTGKVKGNFDGLADKIKKAVTSDE